MISREECLKQIERLESNIEEILAEIEKEGNSPIVLQALKRDQSFYEDNLYRYKLQLRMYEENDE